MGADILSLMFIGSIILNLVLMITLVILGSLLKNESDEACKVSVSTETNTTKLVTKHQRLDLKSGLNELKRNGE